VVDGTWFLEGQKMDTTKAFRLSRKQGIIQEAIKQNPLSAIARYPFISRNCDWTTAFKT